jgi:hypothetical protein
MERLFAEPRLDSRANWCKKIDPRRPNETSELAGLNE